MNEAMKKAMQKPLVVNVSPGHPPLRTADQKAATAHRRRVTRSHHRDPQGVMSADNQAEVLDIVTGAVDKFLATENYEVRSRCGGDSHQTTITSAATDVWLTGAPT